MPFSPLLSATTKESDLKDIQFPILWSPKLDGIRTLIHPILGPITRKGVALPNLKLRKFLSHPALNGLDGELVFGRVTAKDVFAVTQSAVMTISGPSPIEDDGRYLVFDDFTSPNDPFTERHRRLINRVKGLPSELLKQVVMVVPHEETTNLDDLMNVERMLVTRGYEGLMGRDPQGIYKFGRSTKRDRILFKIKRFVDAEAVVVTCNELNVNENQATKDQWGHSKRSTQQENLVPGNVLGSFTVKSSDFDENFNVGSGFNDYQRQKFWIQREKLIGKTICFKFQASGVKDKPRFPVFKGFRED